MDPATGTCPPGVTTTFGQSDLVFDFGPRGTNTAWDPTIVPAPPLVTAPEATVEQTIVGLTIGYDITDTLTFKSITGYVGYEGNFMTDFGNGPIGAIGGSEDIADQFTQEFQLLGTAFDERLNFVTGLYYLNEEADQLWGWFLPFPPLHERHFREHHRSGDGFHCDLC